MVSSLATRAASVAGIFSSTRAKHPASSSSRASLMSFSASASSLARTVYEPYLLMLCGMRPRCPMMGMPAARMRRTASITSTPPSSLSASAWVIFIILMAFCTASMSPVWYEPKGMSTTTRARCTPRTTDLAMNIIWSSVTGSVVRLPHITFEAESPTSITSTPASSTMRPMV